MLPHSLRLLVSALAAHLFIGGGAARAMLDVPLRPIPEARALQRGFDYQRVRFITTPLITRAARAADRGDYDTAATLLREALSSDPGNPALLVALAEAEGHRGHWDGGLEAIRRVVKRHPEYRGGWALQAHLADRAGYVLEAQAAYESLLARTPRTDPLRAAVYQRLILLCRRHDDEANARRYALQWAQLTGEAPPPEAAAAPGQPDTPAGHLEWLRTEGERQLRQGYLAGRDGKWPEARACFEQAREFLPDTRTQREIEEQLGRLAFRAGAFGEAADHFKRSLLLHFNDGTALTYLHALKASGQVELGNAEAKSLLKRVAESSREDVAALAAYFAARLAEGAAR